MTLYQLKESMATLGAEISEISAWIGSNAALPQVQMEDIKAKKARREELQERFDSIKAEHDRLEAQERAKIPTAGAGAEPKKAKEEAKATFYRQSILGKPVDPTVSALLGAIPEGALHGGENLLPSNMETELITEPMETNSMRSVEQVSNITGLELPKLDFEFEEDDLEDVTDSDTAREIKTEGSKVSFGRLKTKIKVKLSETVVYGTPTNLVQTVENGLRSGLALKEKMREFALLPKAEHDHMSFYSSSNKIKRISGNTMLNAILACYGDLADMFAENARVVMRRTDYVAMIRDLANGSESLFGKKPEDVIGIPVVFNDRARKPIVGDFRFSRWNYENGTIYDTDKDVDEGVYKFVLTAWHDHRILLRSAFRIAEIGEESTSDDDTLDVRLVSALPTSNIRENTIYVLTVDDGDKLAGSMWIYAGGNWEAYV